MVRVVPFLKRMTWFHTVSGSSTDLAGAGPRWASSGRACKSAVGATGTQRVSKPMSSSAPRTRLGGGLLSSGAGETALTADRLQHQSTEGPRAWTPFNRRSMPRPDWHAAGRIPLVTTRWIRSRPAMRRAACAAAGSRARNHVTRVLACGCNHAALLRHQPGDQRAAILAGRWAYTDSNQAAPLSRQPGGCRAAVSLGSRRPR